MWVGTLARALTVGAVLAGAWLEAWRDSGSIAASGPGGWLPYAVVLGLLVAAVLASGAASRPARPAWLGVALLGALAAWAYASLSWSSVPSLARDEGLLTAVYALCLLLPSVSLRSAADRTAALAVATGVLTTFAVAVACVLAVGSHPATRFVGGRLYFPITYANAQGAFFALGFWPAVLFAARRRASALLRIPMCAAAGTLLAAVTLTQSKGAVLGLVVGAAVVVAVSPERLRLLVPVGFAVAVDAVAFMPLTAPFRDETDHTSRQAGVAVLIAGAATAAIGAAYVAVDRRLALTQGARRMTGRIVGVLAIVVALGSVASFFLAERHPERFVTDRWHSFKHLDATETGGSHFVNFGSNRYDYWRVAVQTFERHPVTGCGARCFGPVYLIERRSHESPARAHSLPLAVLAEQGLVGFALLASAFGVVVLALARLARRGNMIATAALGTVTCWLAHACVDWIWTFPSVTAPMFAVAGIGIAGAGTALPVRWARLGAAAATAVALFAFAPIALAGWLTQRALAGGDAGTSLRWARRLDPVSTAPVIAEALRAPTAAAELSSLQTAARMEPRVVATQYLLGVAYLNVGRKAAARAQLDRALALDPQNPSVLAALRALR